VLATTIIGGSITLGEVVGLDLVGGATEPFLQQNFLLESYPNHRAQGRGLLDEQPSSTYPVDLIKGVGLEDNAGDDTGTRSGNQIDLELAEEDVAGAADGRGLLLVGDAEDGTLLLVVGERGALGEVEEAALALGEINGEVSTDGRVGRAVCWSARSCQSYTIHPCLACLHGSTRIPTLLGRVAQGEGLGGDHRSAEEGEESAGNSRGAHFC
jgi:hypothetical protein